MKKETSRRRRFRILFRRRLRHCRRLLGKSWFGRGVKALFRRCIDALMTSDDYGVRFVVCFVKKMRWRNVKACIASLRASVDCGVRFIRDILWRKLASILSLLLVGVWVGPDLLLWADGLWNQEAPDGGYYLRLSLIAAGAALLAVFVLVCFCARRNVIRDSDDCGVRFVGAIRWAIRWVQPRLILFLLLLVGLGGARASS